MKEISGDGLTLVLEDGDDVCPVAPLNEVTMLVVVMVEMVKMQIT